MNIHKGKGLNTLARTLHTIPFLYGSGRFFQPTLDGHYLIVHIFSLKTQTVRYFFSLALKLLHSSDKTGLITLKSLGGTGEPILAVTNF